MMEMTSRRNFWAKRRMDLEERRVSQNVMNDGAVIYLTFSSTPDDFWEGLLEWKQESVTSKFQNAPSFNKQRIIHDGLYLTGRQSRPLLLTTNLSVTVTKIGHRTFTESFSPPMRRILGNPVVVLPLQGQIRFCALILYFVKNNIFSHFTKNVPVF